MGKTKIWETVKGWSRDWRITGAFALMMFLLVFGGIGYDLLRFKWDQEKHRKAQQELQDRIDRAEREIEGLPTSRLDAERQAQEQRINTTKEVAAHAKRTYKQLREAASKVSEKPIIVVPVGPLADPDNDLPGIPDTESVCTRAETLGVPCYKFNRN